VFTEYYRRATARHITSRGQVNSSNNLAANPERKGQAESHTSKWDDNIKMILKWNIWVRTGYIWLIIIRRGGYL
jgi:hypothetical protein